MAVFKVFFQHNKDEVIVRENTNTIYVEGETVRTSKTLFKRPQLQYRIHY